ncbi:MAG: heme-binding protein [SAR202 cluster bacterium]|nr:hypothetical protein [Chloroflexota bacterium]MQG39392.1 heme-binding protein [SAR202 cluster bacterium]
MKLTLDQAEKIISFSKEKITELGVKMSVTVTDDRGDLIAMIRCDGASWRTPTISRGKAVAAACFGLSTKELESRAGSPIFQAFTVAENGMFIMGQGALPVYIEGELVGAVGASGGTPVEDEEVVGYAISKAGLSYK